MSRNRSGNVIIAGFTAPIFSSSSPPGFPAREAGGRAVSVEKLTKRPFTSDAWIERGGAAFAQNAQFRKNKSAQILPMEQSLSLAYQSHYGVIPSRMLFSFSYRVRRLTTHRNAPEESWAGDAPAAMRSAHSSDAGARSLISLKFILQDVLIAG